MKECEGATISKAIHRLGKVFPGKHIAVTKNYSKWTDDNFIIEYFLIIEGFKGDYIFANLSDLMDTMGWLVAERDEEYKKVHDLRHGVY